MPTENKTPAVMKKDLPDELYPGAPIEDMGSTVPEAEPAAHARHGFAGSVRNMQSRALRI